LVNAGECRLEEQSKSLESYHNYRVKNVSALKDDISSLPNDFDAAICENLNTVSCQQPQPNSGEQQKLAARGDAEKDVTANKTNAMNLAETDGCSEQCEKSSGPGSGISVDRNMPDKVAGNVETSRDVEKAASSLPNQPQEDGLPKDGEVIGNPKNSEPTKEKSSSDKPSLNSKHPNGDKSTHIAEGGDDPKKQAPDPASNNTPDASSSTYKKVTHLFDRRHFSYSSYHYHFFIHVFLSMYAG